MSATKKKAKPTREQLAERMRALVIAVNALAVRWSANKKWWLPASERAELEAVEAKQSGLVWAP